MNWVIQYTVVGETKIKKETINLSFGKISDVRIWWNQTRFNKTFIKAKCISQTEIDKIKNKK